MTSARIIAAAVQQLQAYVSAFPETTASNPWGHIAYKVGGKTFVWLTAEPGAFTLSTKLSDSNEAALHFPFTEPTHYGAGKWGWVTSSFDTSSGEIPVGILKAWIDESWRNVAPKRLTRTAAKPAPRAPKRAAKAAPKKRPPVKKKKARRVER
jgi:predicted DNA-binding protein (MmcQ/YjbR family)